MSFKSPGSWLFGNDAGGHFPGPYGLQLYSLRKQMPGDVKPWLERVRKMGYQEAELSGLEDLSPQKFHRALESAGLRAVGMHNSYARYRHQMPAIIQEARALGVEYLVCPDLPKAGRHTTMADVHRAAREFNRFAAQLERHDLRFGFHAEIDAFYPIDGRPALDRLIALLRPDIVQEMDIFWYKRGGQDPVTYLKRYPKLFRLMHLKGMRRGTPVGNFNVGTSDEDCVPLGQGILDIPSILQEAMRIGVQHYFVEDESREAPKNIATDIRYLKTVRV
ncbi:MAG: sugar phosphate isomerase/epimerase family protein [Terriglobia bacterium]